MGNRVKHRYVTQAEVDRLYPDGPFIGAAEDRRVIPMPPLVGELERRVPADLNPWHGVAVLALHSHTAVEPCDDQCTVYKAKPPSSDAIE